MAAEGFIQVNIPATLGKKLKSFETVDGHGDVVQVQTVTQVDSNGVEIAPSTEATQLDILAAIRAQSSGVFSDPFTGINGDAVPFVAAMPIAQPATTLLRAGAASGFALANAIGLVVVGNGLALPVRALADGVLTLPTAAWDAITGDAGGLVPGARYYLGIALGTIGTAAPTLAGQYVTVIGSAISSVTLLVRPEPPILL
jgi:hypothetical protein